MAAPYSASIDPTQVGSYFVQQYYPVLQQRPDVVYQFYTDSSSMLRVDGDSCESATTMVHIDALITSMNFTSIKIKTINSLESWSGSVLVIVSGTVKTKDSAIWRNFTQTFLLAPQEKGYFVMNDVFHFLDEEIHDQPPVPVVEENKFESHPTTSTPLPDPPVSDYGLEVEASEYVNSVHIEVNDPVEDYSYQDHHPEYASKTETVEETSFEEETAAEESSPSDQNAADIVQESQPVPEEPVGEPPKFTYASILRASKGKSAPSVVAQPSFVNSTPPASEWYHTPQPAVQPSNSVPSNIPDSGFDTAEESLLQDRGESKSVYVRNLPTTVSTVDLFNEFKNFGRIKEDGVFLKNRKDVGVCFAFVEFEDIESVQNAIKASPIQLAGRQVYIEERRANSSGISSRGGRRGRGRGPPGARGGAGRGNYQDGGLRSNGFRNI